MILAKEITEWEVDYRQPNHTYLIDDKMSKMYGYFKWHNTKDFIKFKNPLRLDTRYRKFKILRRYEEKTNAKRWEINGSKGNVYYVEETDSGMTCTCVGYKFHGKCKHIDQVNRENNKTN